MSIIAEQIAEQIEGFLARRKLQPELQREKLAKQILQYMNLRRRCNSLDIVGPKRRVSSPDGWDDHAEQVWLDWFSNEVHLSDWMREVFRPVFGTEECGWDYAYGGWREELFAFLPWWAQRSYAIVGAYDATPYDLEAEAEADTDPRSAMVDPYLMDHGQRR